MLLPVRMHNDGNAHLWTLRDKTAKVFMLCYVVFLVMAGEEKEGNTCCVLASSRVHVAEVTFTVQHLGA